MSRNRNLWIEPLTSNGWRLTETCVCGGVYQEKFEHNDYRGYEITVYPDGNKMLGPRFVMRFYRLQKLKDSITKLSNTLTTYEFKKT